MQGYIINSEKQQPANFRLTSANLLSCTSFGCRAWNLCPGLDHNEHAGASVIYELDGLDRALLVIGAH